MGQAVTVNYSVAVNAPGSGTPTGNVTVSDGTQSCTGTVAAGTVHDHLHQRGRQVADRDLRGRRQLQRQRLDAGTAHQVNKGRHDDHDHL